MENNTVEQQSLVQTSAKQKDSSQITVIDIINMMFTFWWVIVLMAVLAGGATYAYTKLTAVPTYSSSGMLYINTQAEQKTNDVNTSAIQGVINLMPTYVEVLQSQQFLDVVSDDIGNKFDSSEIKKKMTITTQEKTNIIKISVSSEDAHDAFLICDSIVNNAYDEIIRVFEGGSVKLLDVPHETASPNSTNAVQRGIIGFAAGAVLAMLIVFLINLFDTRIKGSEELASKYNLPILGEVSNLHES